MGGLFTKEEAKDAKEEDGEEVADVKAIPIAVAVQQVEAKLVEPPEVVDPETFYSRFGFKVLEPRTDEDKELFNKKESSEERILDLLLIMDCTSSMSVWIELSKNTLKESIDALLSQHQDLRARVGFIGYRDFGDKSNIFLIQDFTFDVEGIKEVISGISAKGGQDIPEDLQGALYQGLKLNWREVSVKVCYLCTDAPCHGQQYHSVRDEFPKGNPSELVLEDLMCEYSDRDIDFTVYELMPQTKKMFNTMEKAYNSGANTGQFTRIELEKEIEEIIVASAPLAATVGTTPALRFDDMIDSIAKVGGEFEKKFKGKLERNLRGQADFQYQKHGWTPQTEGFSYYKKERKKAKNKFGHVSRYRKGS